MGNVGYVKSTDNGTSWQSPQQLPAFVISHASFISTQPGAIMCIFTKSNPPAIQSMVSTDNGTTWSVPSTVTTEVGVGYWARARKSADGTLHIVYQDSDSDTIPLPYAAENVMHMKSSDTGTTWTPPYRITRYALNDVRPNFDFINTTPFITFASDRFFPRDHYQLWYSIAGVTPDSLAPPAVLLSQSGHRTAGYDTYFRTYVADETGIVSVVAEVSVDGVTRPPLPLYDDGLHWDLLPGDNVWGNVVATLPVGLIEFRADVTNAAGIVLQDFLCLSYTSTPGPLQVPSTQGDSMKVAMDVRGTFGKTVYPQPSPYMGMGYGAGSIIEHLYGAGIWVGGKIDTSSSGTGQPVRAVSTAYEGWSGPQYEFSPAGTPADTIWRIARNQPRPPGWDAYWGASLPFRAFADQNFYCAYADYYQPVSGHVPLGIKIVQSSFTWNDTESQGIQILEFKLMNNSQRLIDSCYIAFFADGDVGPVNVLNYHNYNSSDYYSGSRTGYIYNPVHAGSTPMGVSILNSVRPLDSLRFTYRWYEGGNSPSSDIGRYALMRAGGVNPSGFPYLADVRFLLSFGPFTLKPYIDPQPDTLNAAFALLSGNNLTELHNRALRAGHLYRTTVLDVEERTQQLPTVFSLEQNYPNPFNPSTSITFHIPRTALTCVVVYDVLGREVSRLVNEELPAGTYTHRFDAHNLASGVYFYRLQSGPYVQTRKALLLK